MSAGARRAPRRVRQATLCVFAKPPRPGEVKTRLATALGDGLATALARSFLDDTWRAVTSIDWARPILATTARDAALPTGEVWLQGDGDLGTRIERVLSRALADTPIAIAIGADSPGLPRRLLDAARDALRDHDAVIGPASDGGFYLLGLRTCPAGLLAHVPWSDATTCERAVRALDAHGLATAMLPPWFDVDRLADLERLRSLLAAGDVHAPATARVLENEMPHGTKAP